MIHFKSVTMPKLKRVLEHQDPHSERHRLDMQFKSPGVRPDPWLESLSPMVKMIDPQSKVPPTLQGFIGIVKERAQKGRRRGRALSEIAYRLIYNPCNEVQSELRALSIIAPDVFQQAHVFLDREFALSLYDHFAGSLLQRAFHTDTGRWHSEGTICKLDCDGKIMPWAKGLRYDTADRTAEYETRLSYNEPVNHLRVNSRMVVRLRREFTKFMALRVLPVLKERKLLNSFKDASFDSYRVLTEQAIRREIGFVIKYPNPNSSRVAQARARISKWTEEFAKKFPGHNPPTFEDFSLFASIGRAVDGAVLSESEKKLWVDQLVGRIVQVMRVHMIERNPEVNLDGVDLDDCIHQALKCPRFNFNELDEMGIALSVALDNFIGLNRNWKTIDLKLRNMTRAANYDDLLLVVVRIVERRALHVMRNPMEVGRRRVS